MTELTKHISGMKSDRGFTLVELLVTLVITSVIMSAVIVVYSSTLHTSRAEDQRVDLQQNHRFAIDLLMANLRHAGYDKWEKGEASIIKAGEDYIYFTADFQGLTKNLSPTEAGVTKPPAAPAADEDPDGTFPDGEIDDNGEHIVFCRYTVNGEDFLGYVNSNGDDDGDGVVDNVIGNIDVDNDGFADPGHSHGSQTHQPVVGIDGLEFFYTLSSGGPTTFPSTPAELERIRSVQVALLARHDNTDIKYSHLANIVYQRPSGGVWTNIVDNYRRRLLTAEVRFRNMGLE